jgi:proline racemase
VSARVPGLGTIKAVTGVNGETYVCVDWRKQMLGMPPAVARELAEALLAVAGEAEAIDAATAAVPVQDELFGREAA